MNFNFDKFRNIKSPEVMLCNPDKRKIAVIETRQANLSLRFNDLSEINLQVLAFATNQKGEHIKYDYYDRVETQRLILIDKIGYFKIMNVQEFEDGIETYKSVVARSLQVRLNDFGFFMEYRLYSMFNVADPFDTNYDPEDLEHIPSVVGQLHQQLQIQIDPRVIQNLPEMEQDFDQWTISYINPVFRFYEAREDNTVRTFTEENTLWGMDFILNHASELFEAIFEFDFLRQAIKIRTVEEVTQRTNIYLSFDNLIKEMEVTENADDIVTVLSCTGNNLDIRAVNPTGTNYIADFSHYMAEEGCENPKWMSTALSDKLRLWEKEVTEVMTPAPGQEFGQWEQLVLKLRGLYQKQTELNSDRVFYELKLQDLESARDRYLLANTDELNNLEDLDRAKAIFTAEAVLHDSYSRDELGIFGSIKFNRDTQFTCYRTPPQFIQQNRTNEHGVEFWSGRFSFAEHDDGRTATFNANYLMFNNPDSPTVEPVGGHIYFADAINGDNLSYCKLIGEVAEIDTGDPDNPIYRWQVARFERYTIFSNVRKWIEVYQGVVNDFMQRIEANATEIETVTAEMNAIAERLNLQRRFNLSDPAELRLFRELKNYWIENEYINDGLAVLDITTPEESIDLARELLEEGRKHLSRVNQPRFSLNVEAVDFTKIKEFRTFASELGLGKVITVQKTDDLHYFPALTTIELDLHNPDDFALEFSNALKPNSQDFAFADLVHEGVSMARSVSQNWQGITKFSRREHSIDTLLNEPLNRTLRAARQNMSRQNFIIDETGILGRRHEEGSETTFENEQIRIINNVLMFTDDGWQTARTALGKIDFTHPTLGRMQAYGLLAEAIVGSLIVGNSLFIANENNSIVLDLSGIKITAPGDPTDIRFHADNNGNVSLKGTIVAQGGEIGGLVIENSSIRSTNGSFFIDSDGHLFSTSGRIGGWKIEHNRLISSNAQTGDGYVGMRSDTDPDIYSFWAGWPPATTVRSFQAHLISSTEELEEHRVPEPTIAGTYNHEGGVIIVDGDSGENLINEFADRANRLRALSVGINTDANEITFTLPQGSARYQYFFVGGVIVLGEMLSPTPLPIDLDITMAAITISGTLMTTRWSYKEEIYWPIPPRLCVRCNKQIDDCICGICVDCGGDPCECLCDGCDELLGECTCVCDECDELLRTACVCECDECGELKRECVCPFYCCNENPCVCECSLCGEHPCICPPWICSGCDSHPCVCVPPTPRTITVTATYRQVHVELPPIPQSGLLHVEVATNAALVSDRLFSIEIRNTATSATFFRSLTVEAGARRSSTSTTVPIDLTTYNPAHWQLRFTQNNSSLLSFTQTDLLGTPTATTPNFGVMPSGYLVAQSGRIGQLNFEGERLYSSSFSLETVIENGRLVSHLIFFDTADNPTAVFSSNYLRVPSVFTEYLGGNNTAIEAASISTNTLTASGTITANRVQGTGGASINVNAGASAVHFTASVSTSSSWINVNITVRLNRQVISPVTIRVQYQVIGGGWHTLDYHFSGSTTSITRGSVNVVIGIRNTSIISNSSFWQTPAGSGVRIDGNLNWNGRQLFINGSDNTVRAY